jgi:hypothetical protein
VICTRIRPCVYAHVQEYVFEYFSQLAAVYPSKTHVVLSAHVGPFQSESCDISSRSHWYVHSVDHVTKKVHPSFLRARPHQGTVSLRPPGRATSRECLWVSPSNVRVTPPSGRTRPIEALSVCEHYSIPWYMCTYSSTRVPLYSSTYTCTPRTHVHTRLPRYVHMYTYVRTYVMSQLSDWKRAHMCTENHVCFGRIHGSQLREGANAGQHTPHSRYRPPTTASMARSTAGIATTMSASM